MSQITCCPFCATKFKVVPDQLRISEGWVRCGQCKEIFDAAAHLQVLPLPVAADKAMTCWLSGETALRALTKASRNLFSASF